MSKTVSKLCACIAALARFEAQRANAALPVPGRAESDVKKTDAAQGAAVGLPRSQRLQLSFNVTARLNTGQPSTESTRSATK